MKPDPLIHLAAAAVVALGDCTPLDLQRALLGLCETKEQSNRLSNELQRLGYIERRVIVTDRARKRVAV